MAASTIGLLSIIDKQLITQAKNMVVCFRPSSPTSVATVPLINPYELSKAVFLTTLNAPNNPTLGNGTMVVKITYTIKTFGE